MREVHNPDMRIPLASSYDELLIYQGQWSKVQLNHRHEKQANAG
jgi:hypothetical protein